MDELKQYLESLLRGLDEQISKIEETAAEMGIPGYTLRNADGSYVLPSLLSAKAQALHSLALLGTIGKENHA